MNPEISASEAEIFVTVSKVLSISSHRETEDPACLRCWVCGRVSCCFERPLRGVAVYQFQLDPNHSPGLHKDELSTQSDSYCDLCDCQTQTHPSHVLRNPPTSSHLPSDCRVIDDDSHRKMFYFVNSLMLVCRVSDLHSTARA